MNVKRIFSVLLLLCVVVGATSAYCPVMVGGAEACCLTGDGDQIHLNVKKLINHPNNDFKEPRTPILVPELTMDGHTLHFVTPCTGLTLRLVHDDEVCCETVITSDNVEIPSALTGVYELQILRGDYIFFAEVEL